MSDTEARAPAEGPISVFGVDDDRPLVADGGRYVLCSVDEVSPGMRKIFTGMGGRGIGIFNVAGRYYAVRNICPHKGAPLCYGRLRPHVVSPDVGAFSFEREGQILKCPWHQWEFDLATGWSLYAPRLRVRTYPVTVEDGKLVLHVAGDGEAPGADRREGEES